jgi:acyl-CoA synthetase (AMP-forming)/AMP-acid ligase II
MKELVYPRLFEPACRLWADKTCLVDLEVIGRGAYRATFAEHRDRVLRLCAALRHELRIGRGDRFAVLAGNCHQFLELYHAAYLGAGVINPLNVRLAGPELDYIVRDSGTEVAFVDRNFAVSFNRALHEAGGKSPIRRVVLLGEGGQDPGALPHDTSYEELLAAHQPEVPAEPDEDDPVVLMYTGGTTGLPKGVLVSQRAEILNVYHVAMRYKRLDESTVNLMQTPMFHAASMVGMLGTPANGGTLVTLPMFEPGLVIDTIEREGVTVTTMVPTMIAMTLAHPSFAPERLRSLESLTYGASPMPAALLDRLLAMFPDLDISQGYGMTESSSVLTFLGPDEHRRGGPELRSVGRPLMGIELSIQDENGNELPPGEIGEVCAKGGNYMTCYWNKPRETEEAFRGGWYHTGDAGYLDENGYLYLVDRVKDMIVSGGENVYSIEVENAIATHPAVLQVAVIGVPHEVWGEAVHAIVVPRQGAVVEVEEIIAHARSTIAGYKVPKTVELRATPLPLSGAMKVLKRELRKPYWEERERAI